MTLPVKITLLLAVVVILFISINSVFLYKQINENFTRQSQERMDQSLKLIDQRLLDLKHNLEGELDQLAGSLFTENETVLASMLSDPPDFTPEVIGFAEKLRRRTPLHFLIV